MNGRAWVRRLVGWFAGGAVAQAPSTAVEWKMIPSAMEIPVTAERLAEVHAERLSEAQRRAALMAVVTDIRGDR